VFLNEPEGARLLAQLVADQLKRTGSSLALRVLAKLETQENLGACGPASAVSVLNALEFRAPRDPRYAATMPRNLSYPFWTQDAFVFSPCATRVLGPYVFGETLDGFSAVLSCIGLSTDVVHAAGVPTADAVRRIEGAINAGAAVVANFDRRVAHEVGGGHFSPLGGSVAGYFFVLDVARYRYQPVFVPHDAFVAAMATPDDDQADGKSRGFVVLARAS